MPERRTVSRCGACGADAAGSRPATLEQCPELPRGRSGRVVSARTSTRADTLEVCVQPITERIADKNARNDCAVLSLRVTVERDASRTRRAPATSAVVRQSLQEVGDADRADALPR